LHSIVMQNCESIGFLPLDKLNDVS
jgi:hypothetical protein